MIVATHNNQRSPSALRNYSNRTTYLHWALHSFEDQCLIDAPTLSKAMFVPKMPILGCAVELSENAAAWLAGMTQAAIQSHPHLFDGQSGSPSFVSAWGSITPDCRPLRLDASEQLFNRWVSLPAGEWEDFYILSLQALSGLKGVAFDLASLYDIAYLRTSCSDDDSKWEDRCYECFTKGQPPAGQERATKLALKYALQGHR